MDKKDKSKYKVGYKKPPRGARFKPGQSGNPEGRPKKSMTLADEFAKELESIYQFNIGGQVQKLPMRRVIAKKHVNKAAAGDAKSTALLLNAVKPLASNQENNIPELLNQFRAIYTSREAADRSLARSADAEQEANTSKDGAD